MRLDCYLVEKQYFDSRTKAKQAIERGEIFINGKVCNKPAFEILEENLIIEYLFKEKYVSLGGYKLNKAIRDFTLDVKDFICIDIGASTGGFTDCLLKNGAKKVYSVDLNDGLLHYTLKEDARVVEVIKNVKDLTMNDFEDAPDLIVADLSFISVSQALPIISNLLEDDKRAIVLIKPQFETGGKIKFKNGIVRDRKIHEQACRKVYDCALQTRLTPVNFTTAPKSSEKNTEFLMEFVKNGEKCMQFSQIKI